MTFPVGAGLRVQGFKSYGSEPQGFDRILPVNLLARRNHAGKSAILDAIEGAIGSGRTAAGITLTRYENVLRGASHSRTKCEEAPPTMPNRLSGGGGAPAGVD